MCGLEAVKIDNPNAGGRQAGTLEGGGSERERGSGGERTCAQRARTHARTEGAHTHKARGPRRIAPEAPIPVCRQAREKIRTREATENPYLVMVLRAGSQSSVENALLLTAESTDRRGRPARRADRLAASPGESASSRAPPPPPPSVLALSGR